MYAERGCSACLYTLIFFAYFLSLHYICIWKAGKIHFPKFVSTKIYYFPRFVCNKIYLTSYICILCIYLFFYQLRYQWPRHGKEVLENTLLILWGRAIPPSSVHHFCFRTSGRVLPNPSEFGGYFPIPPCHA